MGPERDSNLCISQLYHPRNDVAGKSCVELIFAGKLRKLYWLLAES